MIFQAVGLRVSWPLCGARSVPAFVLRAYGGFAKHIGQADAHTIEPLSVPKKTLLQLIVVRRLSNIHGPLTHVLPLIQWVASWL